MWQSVRNAARVRDKEERQMQFMMSNHGTSRSIGHAQTAFAATPGAGRQDDPPLPID